MKKMKKHIITITGLPGSGKTSTADGVAERLGYIRYSSGRAMRELAQKKGISVDEMQQRAITDPTIDDEIDKEVASKGLEENLVIDSRTAFHWIPESFKVLLTLDLHTAAERTFTDIMRGGRFNQTANSTEETYRHMVARVESECARYKSKYNIDYRDESNYDLVVDTGKHTLAEVIEIVLRAYDAWLKN
jgi:cytidylate kinase